MKLNSFPVLDKGSVTYVDVSLPAKKMNKVSHDFFRAKLDRKLISFSSATMIVKAPVFVILHLINEYDLSVLNVIPDANHQIECYIPNESEISASDVNTSKDIKDHMKQTSESLVLTQEGYKKDGCDHFVAQVNMPLSVYNEVVISGSLDKWLRFLKAKQLPKPLESYRETIYDVLKADFPNINVLMGRVI